MDGVLSFGMNKREELYLRNRGLDDTALRSVMWPERDDRPYVVIGQDYPRVDAARLRAMAIAGLHLLIQSETAFDLATVADALPHFEGIDIRRGGGELRNLELIETAVNLQTFVGFDVTVDVDLSALPRLTTVQAMGNSSWSAAANPNLRELVIFNGRMPVDTRIVGTLQSLTFDSVKEVDGLEFLSSVEDLRHVGLVKLSSIDLSALSGAKRLTSLYLQGIKTVFNIDTLNQMPSLRELTLSGVKSAENLTAVRDLDLDELNISPNFLFGPDELAPFVTARTETSGVGKLRVGSIS